MTLQVTFDNAEILAALDRAIEALADPRQLGEDIGGMLELRAQARFDSKVDPAGVPWPPLSPATVAIYESEWFIERNPAFKGGIPGSLLERTRQLRNSLAYNVGDGWVDIGTSRRVPGASQPYWEVGVLHEWGTRKMPRRGILTADPATGALAPADEAEILAIVERTILDAF